MGIPKEEPPPILENPKPQTLYVPLYNPYNLQCPTLQYFCSAHGNVSLLCPRPQYVRSAQGQSLLMANRNRRAFLQRPAAEHLCSAQPHSISAAPMATHACSAQTHTILAVLSGKVFLWCPALAAMPNPTDAHFC